MATTLRAMGMSMSSPERTLSQDGHDRHSVAVAAFAVDEDGAIAGATVGKASGVAMAGASATVEGGVGRAVVVAIVVACAIGSVVVAVVVVAFEIVG